MSINVLEQVKELEKRLADLAKFLDLKSDIVCGKIR